MRQRVRARAALAAAWAALCVAVSAAPVAAHPHVFIENRVRADFASGALTGFALQWNFDALFTTGVLSLSHIRRGETLTPQEAAAIKSRFFDNLVHYGYFIHVWQGSATIPVARIDNFAARLDGDKLVYTFFARLATPLDAKTSPIRADFYDETYFVDVSFPDNDPSAMTLVGAPPGCSATTGDDPAHLIPSWGVNPQGAQITCK